MILLLVLAALITLATVWFLTRAVRLPAAADTSHDGLVQLRDRLLAQLRELDVEEGDRNVDTTVAVDERRRLEAELAQVLKALDAHSPPSAGEGTPSPEGRGEQRSVMRLVVIIALAVVLPVASLGLYFAGNASVLARLGDPTMVASREAPAPLEMVARLERRLAEQPNDPQGWARLGRSYTVLGRAQEAQQAYARAYAMAPDDAEIVAAYADFLLARDPNSLPPEAVALFRKLHALEPRHPGALWWLGLAAYRDKKFGEAADFWEQLLRQLPPQSEVESQVRHAAEAARAEAAKTKR